MLCFAPLTFLSYKAIEQLGFCAEQLANGKITITEMPFSPAPAAPSPATEVTNSEPHLRFWFPILTGLSCIISHPHVDVRTKYAALSQCVRTQ